MEGKAQARLSFPEHDVDPTRGDTGPEGDGSWMQQGGQTSVKAAAKSGLSETLSGDLEKLKNKEFM